MEVIQQYKASDGKMFDDEDECLEYEAEIAANRYQDNIACLDDNSKPIPLSDVFLYGISKVYYMKISEEGNDNFTDFSSTFLNICSTHRDYVTGLTKNRMLYDGIFYYNTSSSCWVNIETEYIEMLAKYNKIKNLFIH
jgi:hypothetical protein